MYRKGFTLVELLIVIVVIGILATISVVSYNGIQIHAHDTAVASDLDSTAGLIEDFRVTTSSVHQYPRTQATDLVPLGITASKSSYDTTVNYNFVYCVDTTNNYQGYALIALSKSGKVFVMNQDGFQANTLTRSDFLTDSSTLCHTLGANLGRVSAGMLSPDDWNTWVGGN